MALLLAGKRSRGFFIPYPHAASVPSTVPTYPAVEALFEDKRPDLLKSLQSFTAYLPDLQAGIDDSAIPWEEAGMFPKLDVLVAYCLVRQIAPNRILEIGSGASSHVMARALSDNGQGELVCIDPKPRRSLEGAGARFIERILSSDDITLLEDFQAGDILFIDSSHLMLPGMDVDIQFNRMFPELPSGSIVQVHDIFLPDTYPQTWFHRYYSEQNALIGWILSGYFDVLFPCYHAATRMEADLREHLGDLVPRDFRRNAGSIWLRRR
ncbi:class I SAM-dependent methyltransferase [Actibacterium sp. 188UL27-1]|uniref:class I SAM-dependent methyltransferase n=1 Tax=Actibacterium sp. 188UL27-1 TaxID=2786961 RepID=UPI00195ECDA0|nr:class I SAM-dependent methyltransferase [Actibacterium sp. 188UL27-1]MBM7069994.1 class I SAM-dependent methyltransferase [Actibacterium sp. 188UL27-1]